MYRVLFVVFLTLNVYAQKLDFQSGFIKAHTEVFGDSEINPIVNKIDSKLNINRSLESINGVIIINSHDLKSNNSSRDENMYNTLKAKFFPTIKYVLKSITKVNDKYQTQGSLTLNGVTKNVNSTLDVVSNKNLVNLDGGFSIKLTDFNLEPPTMLFVTVRNQIDITYKLSYKKGK